MAEVSAAPEDSMASAVAAMRRLDADAAVAHLSAALRGFTASGDACGAALASVRLGDLYGTAYGNLTAARAWFGRARRLVADLPPCVEQGWVAVAAMGCDVDDPERLLADAELALDRARRFGDCNLETKALADAGLALVQLGRLDEGRSLLDEAMALACDQADDEDTTAKSVCSFFTACYHAADYDRAGSWAAPLRRHGLIGPGVGGPAFLSGHCDAVHASLLVELGRWGEAETVLQRAVADFEAVMGMPSWHAAIALADLRTRQGRLTEAEQLLLGKEQAMQALLPAARLHLARGDLELARRAATRGVRALCADRLRAAELLAVLVAVEVRAGDLDAAGAAWAGLRERLGDDVPALAARGAVAGARLLGALGRPSEGIELVEAALDRTGPLGLPLVRLELLVALAGLRRRTGDVTAARADAAAAVGLLASLDVVLPAEDHACLADLAAADARPSVATAELRFDGASWWASDGGTTVRLRASKGLHHLAALLGRPGCEHHALDLVDRLEGTDPERLLDRRRLGGLDDPVDATARTAYRRRIEELRADVDEALAAERFDTAEHLQDELDRLVAELAHAFGLGGAPRPSGSPVEKARLNVTRAVRTAVARVVEALPTAGADLDRSVRTGTWCAYEPSEGTVRWVFTRS